MGFSLCEMEILFPDGSPNAESLQDQFERMKTVAVQGNIPIDGIVITYDDIEFSNTCTPTGTKYKDGIAFK